MPFTVPPTVWSQIPPPSASAPLLRFALIAPLEPGKLMLIPAPPIDVRLAKDSKFWLPTPTKKQKNLLGAVCAWPPAGTVPPGFKSSPKNTVGAAEAVDTARDRIAASAV